MKPCERTLYKFCIMLLDRGNWIFIVSNHNYCSVCVYILYKYLNLQRKNRFLIWYICFQHRTESVQGTHRDCDIFFSELRLMHPSATFSLLSFLLMDFFSLFFQYQPVFHQYKVHTHVKTTQVRNCILVQWTQNKQKTKNKIKVKSGCSVLDHNHIKT